MLKITKEKEMANKEDAMLALGCLLDNQDVKGKETFVRDLKGLKYL